MLTIAMFPERAISVTAISIIAHTKGSVGANPNSSIKADGKIRSAKAEMPKKIAPTNRMMRMIRTPGIVSTDEYIKVADAR